MWECDSGNIYLNGVSIRELTLFDLRKQIALVSQDVYLFHGTVEENIKYGNQDATFEQIQEAAKIAHFHDDAMALPNGYAFF